MNYPYFLNTKNFYYGMSKRQDQVKAWLSKAKEEGISQAFIAKKLGMKPQNFNYHLNESPELDLDLFHSIGNLIKKFIDIDFTESFEEKKITPEFEGALSVNQYPILGYVYAGEPEMLEHESVHEHTHFYYNKPKHRCFALRVNGDSMETTLKNGDIVLIDMDILPKDGDLVAVKLKDGKQYIKRYKDLNYAFIQLISDNDKYGDRLVDKNDIIALHKVVLGHIKF